MRSAVESHVMQDRIGQREERMRRNKACLENINLNLLHKYQLFVVFLCLFGKWIVLGKSSLRKRGSISVSVAFLLTTDCPMLIEVMVEQYM